MVAGAQNLGSAYAEIIISADGVRRGINEAKNEFRRGLQEMGSMVSNFGDSVSSMGASLTLMTAPLVAGFASGINAASNFDTAMTEISARTGIVGEDLARVSEYAQQMGAETMFSAQEAAEGLLQLMSSGQSLEEAMSTLPMAMQAAAASGEDLGMTADMVTNVMASFGVGIDRLTPQARALAEELGITNEEMYAFGQGADPGDGGRIPAEIEEIANAMGMTGVQFYSFVQRAEDASTIVESLARGAGASSASIGSLGEGLGNVGTVASQFGMSVDQTVATLAIFAENGIAGAEAGTMLKSMLLQMSSDSDPAINAWRTLGVSLYDAEGNVRDINSVMFDLDRALDQLPIEEQNRLTDDLAGSYGIVGFNALRAGMSIGEMQVMMTEQASAAEVAATMMGTFNNMMGSLGGSVESLQIAVFTPFMNDVLRPLVEQMIVIVNGITDWVRANPELVSTILKIATAAIALGPTLFAVGKVISFIGGTIGLLANPLVWVAAAIAGLVVAFQTNFMGIRDLVQPILDGIVQGFGLFISALEAGATPLQALRSGLTAVFGGETAASITGFVQGIITAMTEIGTAIGAAVTPIIDVLSAMFSSVAAGGDFFSNLYLTMAQLFGPETAGAALAFAFGVREAFTGIVTFVTTTLLPGLAALVQWFVVDGLPMAVNFVTGTVIPAITTFITTLGNIWAVVGPALFSVVDWFITTGLPLATNFVTGTVVPAVEGLIATLIRVWNDVSPFLLFLLDWFVNTGIPIIASAITDVILPVVEFLITQLSNLWTSVSPFLTALYDWFVTTGLPFIQTALTNAGTFVQGFIDIVSGIWNTVEPFLSAFYDGFFTIFENINTLAIQPVIAALNSITGIVSGVQTGISGFVSGAGDFLSGIGDGVQNLFGGGETTVPMRDSGGPGLKNAIYGIGSQQQGHELFAPASNGDFLPNMDARIAQSVSTALSGIGQGGGGITTGDIHINANSYAEGQAAARGFKDELGDRLRQTGN